MDSKEEKKSRYINVPELAPKNFYGTLGDKCNYCSGYGFTNHISGASLSCQRCSGSGIEPIDTRELAAKVDKLTALVTKLLEK